MGEFTRVIGEHESIVDPFPIGHNFGHPYS